MPREQDAYYRKGREIRNGRPEHLEEPPHHHEGDDLLRMPLGRPVHEVERPQLVSQDERQEEDEAREGPLGLGEVPVAAAPPPGDGAALRRDRAGRSAASHAAPSLSFGPGLSGGLLAASVASWHIRVIRIERFPRIWPIWPRNLFFPSTWINTSFPTGLSVVITSPSCSDIRSFSLIVVCARNVRTSTLELPTFRVSRRRWSSCPPLRW